MKKIIIRDSCPYCSSKDFAINGIQEGVIFDLELATCKNKECDRHTFAIAQIFDDKKTSANSAEKSK